MVRASNRLPKLAELPPWEHDIQELLHRFDQAVYEGQDCSFPTFKQLWQEMNFSYIFEVYPTATASIRIDVPRGKIHRMHLLQMLSHENPLWASLDAPICLAKTPTISLIPQK